MNAPQASAKRVREDLVAFLDTIRRPDFPMTAIGDDDPLVESGLIDSLALLQIISYLEERHEIDFSLVGIDPGELGSITAILALIERNGA